MKKILVFMVILVLSASMTFAQEIHEFMELLIVPETQGSVKKQATAYVFGTETDAISAGSVYDLGGDFVSLGHTPSLSTYAMSTIDVGLAFAPANFLGIAAGFDLNTLKLTETGLVSNKPSFFSTIAFGLNKKFGLHYNIAHAAVKTNTTETPPTEVSESVWLHQFSFAMRISKNLKYTLPVGILIYDDETIPDTNAPSITTNDSSRIIVFFNPNFTYYPDAGVTTQFKAGAEVDVTLYNAIGASKTTAAGIITGETKKNTDSKEILWRVYATPTFEWRFLNNQMRLMSDPTLAFDMVIESDGRPAATPSTFVTTTYTMKPSINVPVGIAYKPVEWFEFRSGLLYNVKCEITDTNIVNTLDYELSSLVLVFAGFGFIIADDFTIDLAYQAAPNKVSMDSLSVQLTYRF